MGFVRNLRQQFMEEVPMKKNSRRCFWIETGSATIMGVLALITPICPDWIELVSGWDPDQHSGSSEWMIVAGLFLMSAALYALAAAEWRRGLRFAVLG
jgi:hypothetical protein